MKSPGQEPIVIQLRSHQTKRPEFLEGLDVWLQLGLISESQVLQLCQQHLTCAIALQSIPQAVSSPAKTQAPREQAARTEFVSESEFASEFSSEFSSEFVSELTTPASEPKPPGILQRLTNEISVIWLLFLGVFLVVVSSGVLAASQWKNFSVVGQYTILWGYTVAFGAANVWTGRHPSLRLTARMLKVATLLLIPVNFWMMDGLGVLTSLPGVTLGAIAALSLSGLSIFLLQTRFVPLALSTLNSLGLSWLHWGWGWAGFPLLATYIGIVGTVFLLVRRQRYPPGDPLPSEQPSPLVSESSESDESLPAIPVNLVIALMGLVLLVRAVFVVRIPLDQLGLAIGLSGWLLAWLPQPRPDRILWARAGAGLLIFGWGVTVAMTPPWQAIAISGLALHLLLRRLRTHAQTLDLIASWLVGLQAWVIMGRLFPESTRLIFKEWVTAWFGASALPSSILSLTLFPVVLLTLGLGVWLERRQQSLLAHQARVLALILGTMLTVLSLGNGPVRSLYLALSALTLSAVVWWAPAASRILIYLTHITVLAALVSGIDTGFPQLSTLVWARLLLMGMTVEWGFCAGGTHPRWRHSAWSMGLGLAGCSFVLFLRLAPGGYPSLEWLLAPALLTGLSLLPTFSMPRLATRLSTTALIAPLFLWEWGSLTTWVIALAVSTVLMLLNTLTLRTVAAAMLTIGFALSFLGTVVWKEVGNDFTGELALFLVAIALWVLWGLRFWLARKSGELARVYRRATDSWGVVLTIFSTLVLTGVTVVLYLILYLVPEWKSNASMFISWDLMGGTAMVAGAIAFRMGRSLRGWGSVSLAWGMEIVLALGVLKAGGSISALAIATLGLGLLTQLAGDWAVHRGGQSYSATWHGIPIAYGILGLVLGHSDWAATTGLYTLGTAFICIGIGRRLPNWKPTTILGVLLLSAAAYEKLIYHLFQARGGSPGDGLVLLAGLAALLAWVELTGDRWLRSWLRFTATELRVLANLHWGLGSGLALLALLLRALPFFSPSSLGLWLGLVTLLAAYALFLGSRYGRLILGDSSNSSLSVWTRIGLIEFLIGLTHVWFESVSEQRVWWGWTGAIAAGLGLLLYACPWEKWGWPRLPGQSAAIIFPGLMVLLTVHTINLQSQLLSAAFYGWMAKTAERFRLSYLSLFLLDWAILRYLNSQDLLTSLWISIVLGLSILFIAHYDPSLQTQAPSVRQQRHRLRLLATGQVGLTALYQAEISTSGIAFSLWSLFPIGLGLGLIFWGLSSQVRAFLLVGTALFVMRILRLLWLFIRVEPLALWAIGILLGLLLIWIAATFEARRAQVNTALHHWLTALEEWD